MARLIYETILNGAISFRQAYIGAFKIKLLILLPTYDLTARGYYWRNGQTLLPMEYFSYAFRADFKDLPTLSCLRISSNRFCIIAADGPCTP